MGVSESLIPERWYPSIELIKEGVPLCGHEANGPDTKLHHR